MEDAEAFGATVGTLREGMERCAWDATAEEEMFWERTGIKERGWLEVERAEIGW